ncbi:MAG: 3-phosphoshikimate 1-carboxyvinyltransferase, partial [Devosia sp.]
MLTKLKSLTIIPPGHPLRGRVTPPGSKSITNRALLLAGLAQGTSRLSGALKSQDTALMAAALLQMGVRVEEPDETSFVVTSTGRLAAPAGPLMLGNAGTAVRFLTAAAALVDGMVVVDGDEHMRKRPIGPLVEALRSLGIAADAPTGCPPVMVEGRGGFGAGRVEIDGGLSSQYVSALLMAAPCGSGPVEVALTGAEIGAKGYVELTLAAMRAFGAKVEKTDARTWRVEPTGY